MSDESIVTDKGGNMSLVKDELVRWIEYYVTTHGGHAGTMKVVSVMALGARERIALIDVAGPTGGPDGWIDIVVANVVSGDVAVLINDGIVWQLQGFYGRTAANLIEAGYCQPPEGL